ncbi:hypothetical protein TREES_T100007820 [Tupaia chinensis]|uniref:Uncharacterized protein n=1 Tax=Tupaia chinensis TaxID=246437 RepID=L9KGW6_TUPCH|nr:hypothetical protein TREES_T100007820 [Tupaia chinensis]
MKQEDREAQGSILRSRSRSLKLGAAEREVAAELTASGRSRAYEPCVVVSDDEKHTFKYVVLSDRTIYLTENPPKSIRRVVALRDVVAIDLDPGDGVSQLVSGKAQVKPPDLVVPMFHPFPSPLCPHEVVLAVFSCIRHFER